jgi:hypothetical protein
VQVGVMRECRCMCVYVCVLAYVGSIDFENFRPGEKCVILLLWMSGCGACVILCVLDFVSAIYCYLYAICHTI